MKKIEGQVRDMCKVKAGMVARTLSAVMIILGCLIFVPLSESLDNPHNQYKTVNCGDCHVSNPTAIWWTDQGTDLGGGNKGVCRSCHTLGGPAPFVKTHSSAALSSNKYGDWTRQCTACHNPHTQKQFRVYKAPSYLYSGVSTGLTGTSLTRTGAGWTTDQWAGYIVLPNVVYVNYQYKILSNTADTLTIDTGNGGIDTINLTYLRSGQTFAIIYGKFIKEFIAAGPVRFFGNSSPNNYADANLDGTKDGICEVCHTQTKSATNVPRYRFNDHQDLSHTGNCIDCHKHNEAFAGGGCDACHGYPPETDVAAAPDGLVWSPSPTGSTEGTAHVKHAKGGANYSYSCTYCHYNGMPATPVAGNNQIQIGFSGIGVTGSVDATGSTYNGQTLSAPYSYDFTNGTAQGGAQFQCSNIYCHGRKSDGTNWGGGSATSPMWNAASVACGSCHKATNADPMTTGSHTRHTGTGAAQLNLSCNVCHSTYTNPAVHANGAANVAFSTAGIVSGGTYTGTTTMFDAYGNCTNIYCHSSVQANGGNAGPSSYASQLWGAASVSCDSCHGQAGNSNGEPITGSHPKHVTTVSMACDSCHKGYGSGLSTHANYVVNVAMNTVSYGATAAYSQPASTPGTGGYGSCSSVSCHGSDTPAWGSALASGCESCHLASNALPASHGIHYNDATRVTSNSTGRVASATVYKFNCGNCHNASATQHAGGNVNANRAAEISFTDLATAPGATYAQGGVNNTDVQGFAYTTGGGCSSTYCHGNFTGGLNATPTWGGAAACGTCHKYTAADTMTTGSHSRHIWSGRYLQLSCNVCHSDTASGFALNNRDFHVNKSVNWNLDETLSGNRISANTTYNSVNSGSKTSVGGPYNNCMNLYCHSAAQTASGGPLTLGDTTQYKSVQWGGAPMTCTSCHLTSTGPLSSGSHSVHITAPLSYTCGRCHTGSSVSTHVDGLITFNNTTVSLANYSGDAIPGNSNFGTCSTSDCHGSNSGTWGAANADNLCVTCHGVAGTSDAQYAADPNRAAPGYNGTGVDTNGNNAATDSQVGAHDTHLRALSQYSDPVACNQCHTVPGGVNDAGHFGALPADLTFGTLASANGLTPSYNSGTGQCSNVYCHGAKLPGLSTGGTGSVPVWTDTAYLNGTPDISDSGDCDRCHRSAPGTGSHAGTEAIGDCSACHPHVNADGSFSAGATSRSLHINGVVDAAGGCDACHGAPPGTGTDTNAPAVYAASHAQHYSTAGGTPTSYTATANRSTAAAYVFDCGICHNNSSATHLANQDGFVDVLLPLYSAAGATYSGGTYTAGGQNGPPPGTRTFSNKDGQCSNVYCHGNFGGNGNNASPTWGVASSGDCGTCHDVNASANMTGGSHNTHVKGALGLTCDNCHEGIAVNAAGGILDKTLHVNSALNWNMLRTSNRVGSGATYRGTESGTVAQALVGAGPFGSCNNIYCHSNAQTSPPGGALTYAAPAWGGTVNCGGCHKAGPFGAGAEQDSGSHLKHVSASQYNIACSQCHENAGTGTANHADYQVNVTINGTWGGSYSGSAAPGDAYSTCSSVYCHSNVQGAGGSGVPTSYGAPTWGSGSLNCGSCHLNMDSNASATGSHIQHAQGGVTNYSCAFCHGGYTESAVNTSSHVNKLIDLTFSSTANGTNYSQTGTIGNGYGTCSASACHGTANNSPQWGSNTNNDTCTKCHGVPSVGGYAGNNNLAAPGYNGTGKDLSGATVATDAQVGAHDVHLRATNSYSSPIACTQCHTLPTDPDDAGHFGAAPADFTWGTLASANGLTPSYNSGTGQCSNVYCHGAKMPFLSTGGTGSVPVWTDTAYLNGVPNISGGDCDKCHSSAPTGYAGSHSGSEVIGDCNLCHPHVNADGSFTAGANRALHINGVVDASGGSCDACHGAPPGTGTDTNAPAAYAASHAQHYSTVGGTPTSYSATSNRSTAAAYVFDCGVCHNNNTTTHIANTDGFVDVLLPLYSAAGATYSGGTYTAGGQNGPPPGSRTYSNKDGQCSNVYCHGNFQGSGKTANAPTWGNTASGNCGTCHEASNTANLTPRSGSHEKHVDVDQTIWAGTTENGQFIFNRGYECTLCHKADVGGTGPSSYTISDKSKHVNTFVDWQFNTADSRVSVTSAYSVTSGAFTPSNGVSRAYGNCSNVYCHSIVQTPTGGTLTAGVSTHYSTVQWGASISCGSCHLGDGGHGGGLMNSGSHVRHLNYTFTTTMGLMKCDLCHRYGTDPITNNSQCSSCHTGGERTMHVNGQVNVVFETNYVGSGAAWNGTPAPGDGFASSTCSTTYCHSNAQGAGGSGSPTSYGTPTWGSAAMNCGSCHQNMDSSPTSTGSHTSHAQGGVTNYPCAFCHNGYTETTVPTTTHVNRLIELSFSSTAIGATYSQGAATSVSNGYGTCSTNVCHGTANNSPQWGSNTNADTCTKCHGVPSVGGYAGNNNLAAPGYNGTGKDLGGATVATDAQVGAHDVHLRATSNYTNPIACTQCHALPATVGAAGHFGSAPADFTWGTLASANGLTPGYNSGTGSCSNLYCHGAKLPSGSSSGAGTTPVWNNTAYMNGTPSLAGDCGRCHASPPPSGAHSGVTNINQCNGCHNHVNTDGTFTAGANRALHMNGQLDGGGCNGCHDYDVVGAAYSAGRWTGGTWGSNAKAVEGYGAHAKHINHLKTLEGITSGSLADAGYGTSTARFICGTCHSNSSANHETGFGAGAGGTRVINFGDGAYTEGSAAFSIRFSPTTAPSYSGVTGNSSSVNPKSCSTVGCHFTTTPVWSAY